MTPGYSGEGEDEVSTEPRDDEAQLQINTDGWVRCPVPECGWKMDPEFPDCPEHGPRRSDA